MNCPNCPKRIKSAKLKRISTFFRATKLLGYCPKNFQTCPNYPKVTKQ